MACVNTKRKPWEIPNRLEALKVNGFVLAVEKRFKEKMEQLKVGMNALILENNNLKQELDKKQKLILELQEKA